MEVDSVADHQEAKVEEKTETKAEKTEADSKSEDVEMSVSKTEESEEKMDVKEAEKEQKCETDSKKEEVASSSGIILIYVQ